MSIDVIAVILVAVAVLLVVVLAEQPIWLALVAGGAVGLLLLDDAHVTASTIGALPYSTSAVYSLLIIPMFILMGAAASRAGLAEGLFRVASAAMRRVPGGLGIATVLACAGFAAVTGSSVATVVTIGGVAVEQMSRHGYRPNAAAALVAMGGTLGILIPPSVIMVVYCSLTGESIGRMLLAGVVPGLVTTAAYSIMTVVLFRRGFFTPRTAAERTLAARYASGSSPAASGEPVTAGRIVPASAASAPTGVIDGDVSGGSLAAESGAVSYAPLLYVALLFTIVVGGIYSGLFTATESGAIAAGVALVLVVVRKARSGASEIWRALRGAVSEAASMTAMIFALMIGASVFSFFLLKTGLPSFIARSVRDANLPPLLIVGVSLLLLLALGLFLDGFSILAITVPLLYPIVTALGVDGIWFGILMIVMIELALVTPPVGLNVFVASGVSPYVSPEGIFRAVVPFYLSQVAVVVLMFVFPAMTSWLPDLALGTG